MEQVHFPNPPCLHPRQSGGNVWMSRLSKLTCFRVISSLLAARAPHPVLCFLLTPSPAQALCIVIWFCLIKCGTLSSLYVASNLYTLLYLVCSIVDRYTNDREIRSLSCMIYSYFASRLHAKNSGSDAADVETKLSGTKRDGLDSFGTEKRVRPLHSPHCFHLLQHRRPPAHQIL